MHFGEICSVTGTGEPQKPLVLGPGYIDFSVAAGSEVEAAVVPEVAADAALAVAGTREVRKIERRREASAAVLRMREHDVAAVRAAGEDDFLPGDEDIPCVTGRKGDARQP